MKKLIKYIIPSIITFILLSIIFYINDLYPFGAKPLVQVDADYIYIPILYKIWDLLHTGGDIFFTDLGFGNSIYGSLIIQGSLFSPLNLLLYFVPRNNLVNFMGLFIIIKLALISFTSYIYINYKYNKINYFYKVLFSILYTFNGFIIFNYLNHMWLDIVLLLPVIATYLDKLLYEDNLLGYVIVLSLALIITFYFSYFILIFILFYSFINVYLYNKKNLRHIIFNLGKGTLIAILISSFSSLPLMYQILNSSRFNGSVYTELFSSLPMKSLYVLFNPLFIILFILLLSKFKDNKVKIYSYFILLLLYIIPVIIDPVNALLHGGTYWSFPYRYGFITSFILMDGSLYYISNYVKDKKSSFNKWEIIGYILIVLLLGILLYLNRGYKNIITDRGILLNMDNDIYKLIITAVIIIFLMYILSLCIRNRLGKYLSMSVITLAMIMVFTSWVIYYNKGYYLTTNANDIYNNMESIPRDGRYKVEYNIYTPYYGLMFNVRTLDNWLHIIPGKVLDTHKNLGYYVVDTRDYSYGGTIFSDYLLNIKYLFSNQDKSNDNMYSLVSKYNNKYLYKYNYNLGNAIPFKELKDINFTNRFEYQNDIYKNLFNTNKDIINYQTYKYNQGDTIEYKIDKPGYLYIDLYAYNSVRDIKINDNYISSFNNYIKYLGYYDSSVKISLNLRNIDNVNFMLGFIEKDKIVNLNSNVKYDNNTYYINNTDYNYLFIPVNNIKGIHVYNNKKEVKTYDYIDNYIYIKLNKGENTINIKYREPLFNLGVILSIIGVILLIFNKKLNIDNNKLLLNICLYLYIFITIFIFLYFYLYSLFKYML